MDRTIGKSENRNNDGERLMISLLEIAKSINEVDDDKIIKYKDKDGESQEMTAGAAKKQPDDHPAKVAWNKMAGDGGDGEDVFVFLQSDLEKGNNDTDIIENFDVNEDKISFDTLGMSDVEIELVDNEGGADAILSFNDHADWGSIVLVDVGRLDTEDIIIDSGVAVG